jgi:hypothetical protein
MQFGSKFSIRNALRFRFLENPKKPPLNDLNK